MVGCGWQGCAAGQDSTEWIDSSEETPTLPLPTVELGQDGFDKDHDKEQTGV